MNIPTRSQEPDRPSTAATSPFFAAGLQTGGEGVSTPGDAGNANRSTHRNKLSAKSHRKRRPKVRRTDAEKAHLSAVGKARWAAKQREAMEAALENPLERPAPAPMKPLPGSLPAIDYDRLAEAMLRAQERRIAQVAPVAEQSYATRLVKTDLVVPTNNPVMRILSQLDYPKDREGQVVAMIAANMAPSVNPGDPEGELQAAVQEQAVLAHMKEYVLGLRPELPKTRLEPKYTLNGVAAGV